MTTPPPGGSGQNSQIAALAAAMAQQTQALQALLHQQQTFANLPSSAVQAQQARQSLTPQGGNGGTPPNVPWNQALLGGRVPAPAAPTVGWLRQTAQSFVSQVALNQPRRGAPGPTPPSTPQGGTTVAPAGYQPMMWPGPGGVPGQWTPAAGGQAGAYPMMGMPGTPAVAPAQGGSYGGGSHGGGGMGQWVRSSLPSIGAAVGGPVGAAVGAAAAAATQIPAEVRSQRDKNAYYQSIEGGSNFDAFGERMSEEGYRWSTFGVLGSDEARQAFKGVTKLGYNSKVEGGPGRQDALNFVYHGKTSYGATVDESLQELQVASKSALTNFKDLSTALKDVSDSAGKAGVNAQMARAQMTQLLDQAQSSGYGSSAVGVAQGEQQTLNSYGRSFQGVSASGRLTSSHAYMAASLAGISVSQYLTGGATQKLSADQKLDNATVSALLKPEALTWVKDQLNQSGGNVSAEVAAQIAQEMLQRFYANDPFALSSAAASLSGYSDYAQDPIKAATWIVQQLNGKGAGTTSKDMSKSATSDQKTTSKANGVSTGVGESMRTPGSLQGGTTALGGKQLDQEKSGGFLGIGGHASKAVQAYQDWHGKNGGQEDPVIYSLLNAIHGDDKTKVEVTTKDGKKVVSFADAIKNHRNELASGNAVIMSGDQAGKAVSDILGKNGIDPLRDFSTEASKSDSSGQSLADWQAANTSSNGKLQISLTAEARRLLTVMDSTGVNGAAGSATPPTNNYATNPSGR